MVKNEPHIAKKAMELEARFREDIKEVLTVYAMVDPEIGYVQGMTSITAAIVYNLFIAEWAYKRTKIYRKYKLKFRLKFNRKELFYIIYGIMRYMRLREINRKGLEIL